MSENITFLEKLILQYDERLVDRLEEAYSDEEEKEIVLELIIPQLREKIGEVVSTFYKNRKEDRGTELDKKEIDKFIEEIKRVIQENRELLFTGSYFKKGLKELSSYEDEAREALEENFHERCREILRERGVESHEDLYWVGVKWFQKMKFDEFGKGLAFAGKILGRTVNVITIDIKNQIAEKIGLEKISQEKFCHEIREELKKKGIVTREDLARKGYEWFVRRGYLYRKFKGIYIKNTIARPQLKGIHVVYRLLKDSEKKYAYIYERQINITQIGERLGLKKEAA